MDFNKLKIFPSNASTGSQQDILKRVLDWIYTVIVILGIPIVTVAVIEGISLGKPQHAVQYIVFFIPMLVANFWRTGLYFKIRAAILLICIYILATFNIAAYGFSGAGIPIFFTLFILATLFFDLKGGLFAIGVGLLPMIIIGILMTVGEMGLSVDLMFISTLPISWITASTLLVFLGAIMVISIHVIKKNLTESVQANRKQTEQLHTVNQELRDLIEEKNVLLQELHHRVKNNLNIIISLLNLKSTHITSTSQAISAFKESENQIYSMALVHEKLYHSGNFTLINMKEYIEDLIYELISSFRYKNNFTTNLVINNIYLDIKKAIPCGLIINELVTNTFKHAFSNQSKGWIEIRFVAEQDKDLVLTIRDDGPGLPDNFDVQNPHSLGLQIVALQVKQLNGTVQALKETGTTFVVTFPP